MRKICRNAALIFALICLLIAAWKYWEERSAGSGYEKLKDAVTVSSSESEEPEMTATETAGTEMISETEEIESETELGTESESESETEKEPVEIPIDFASLQRMNADIYAWIQVDGTVIDYPVVQHEEDNFYYLDHTAEGTYGYEGAIYTEDYNTKDFEDPHTVLYGHNMKNGSMFAGLHEFSDRSFFNEHKDITVYLPDEIRHYKIFAAYLYDSRHLLQSFDFSSEFVFEKYIDYVFSIRDMNAFFDQSVEIERDSRIITLSTCYKGMDEKRFLVQAVLVSVEK